MPFATNLNLVHTFLFILLSFTIIIIIIIENCYVKNKGMKMSMVFWNILSPKFYVALTATSFLISIMILIFEWWYFSRYGISFIEQVSLNYLSPLFGTNTSSSTKSKTNDSEKAASNGNQQQLTNGSDSSGSDEDNSPPGTPGNHGHIVGYHVSLECKVWRNPMSLFRGAEYSQLMLATKREPLTFYDMNLSAQDHQTFFTCETDTGKEDMEIMQTAWREREPEARIKSAHDALAKNPDCAPAYILLADEEAKTIVEAEKILRNALRIAEVAYRKSQLAHFQNSSMETQHRRDLNVLIYIRRRLAMCARKMGKVKESIKMMRDIIKEFPMMNLFNIHENLIEALLEIQAYADVQALLAKYDDINLPKSATICYTSALLKARNIGDKFSPEQIAKRGLSMSEMQAVEAIHRAVEFNPHVPKYLLEIKKLIFPPEHILKRGDSEAIAYVFFHLPHWKRLDGALNLLDCTWKGTFRIIPYPLEKGHLFYPYPTCTECTDRELLPDYHDISVYPKKDLPFFIRFTASLCTITAMMAFITYQYPELVFYVIRSFFNWFLDNLTFVADKLELFMPSWVWQYSTTY